MNAMEIVLASLFALAMVAVAGYVHRQVPRFTRGSARVMAVRALLVAVGSAFGATAAFQVKGGWWQTIAFITGFGMVHVPAAVILFIKTRRGAGKS